MELAGRTILITRAASQAEPLRHALEQSGARVLECPSLEIVPVDDWTEVDRAVSALNTYDLLIFTSANAVDNFFQRVVGAGASCAVPIAVIGASTAEKLTRWNLKASLVPRTYRAEGLLELLPETMTGKRVLLPRAEVAREILPEELGRRGAIVDVVTVYRTVKSVEGLKHLRSLLESEKVDALVLTSPSAVRFVAEALADSLNSSLAGVAIAVIGPVAAEAVESMGLKVAVQSDKATIPDLVGKIRSYFSSRKVNT
jgi:uroporphyrinogen III methyltransferase / synthase